MPGNNYARLCAARYNAALDAFASGDRDDALVEDVCLSLVLNFECPRLTQIRAWQLCFLCTKDYAEARGRLSESLAIIEGLDYEDGSVIAKCREKTMQMLEELEDYHRSEELKKSEVLRSDALKVSQTETQMQGLQLAPAKAQPLRKE